MNPNQIAELTSFNATGITTSKVLNFPQNQTPLVIAMHANNKTLKIIGS